MIPHNRPTLGTLEAAAAQRVLESGWVAQGPEVAAFENEICNFLGLPEGHAVALSSGTAALFMALWVLGAQGHKVAIPVYSCASLRNAVLMAGGIPVLVDVVDGTPNIDLQAAMKKGAELAIAAHMFGIPLRWDVTVATIPIIEDCAQALGARIDGHAVGLAGKVGVFSYYATKMITSGGQGGMLVSQDPALVDAVRDYREFDCRHDRQPRFNFQMTDLQAALGRAQLKQLPEFIQKRQNIFDEYLAAGINLINSMDRNCEPVRYRAVMRTPDASKAVRALSVNQVKAIVPVESRELLDKPSLYPFADLLTASTVSLPIYPNLCLKKVKYITNILRELT